MHLSASFHRAKRRGIARTQEKHLDLIALLHAVALELVLNLLVPGLALLLLRAHPATHGDGWLVALSGRTDRWWWCVSVGRRWLARFAW